MLNFFGLSHTRYEKNGLMLVVWLISSHKVYYRFNWKYTWVLSLPSVCPWLLVRPQCAITIISAKKLDTHNPRETRQSRRLESPQVTYSNQLSFFSQSFLCQRKKYMNCNVSKKRSPIIPPPPHMHTHTKIQTCNQMKREYDNIECHNGWMMLTLIVI